MRHTLCGLVCVAVGIAMLCAVRPASALDLAVAVNPNPYSGPCPQDTHHLGVLHLTGTITGDTPNSKAQYQFLVRIPPNLRPFWTSPQQSIVLDASGSASVAWTFTPPPTTATLTPATGQYEAGINVLSSGGAVQTTWTAFKATCTPQLSTRGGALTRAAPNQPLASIKGLIILEGPRSVSPRGAPRSKVDDCASYFVAAKMGDGSVRSVQARPAGIDRCSFTLTAPWQPSLDILVGFGGPRHGWLISKRHIDAANTSELTDVSFTFKKIDLEHQMGKTSVLDDWTTSP